MEQCSVCDWGFAPVNCGHDGRKFGERGAHRTTRKAYIQMRKDCRDRRVEIIEKRRQAAPVQTLRASLVNASRAVSAQFTWPRPGDLTCTYASHKCDCASLA